MRWFLGRLAYPGAAVAPVFLLAACSTLHPRGADADCGPGGDCPPGKAMCHPMRVCDNPTVMTLAQDLDHLERHIDWFGSVTAKVPDVWGQARLTQYREQFEALMDPADEKNKLQFELGLQGAQARSDQAFFASATAISAAAQPKPPFIGTNVGKGLVPQSRETVVVSETVNKTVQDFAATDKTTTTTKEGTPADSPKPEKVKPLDLDNPASLLEDPKIVRNEIAKQRMGFGRLQAAGIGIEPTLMVAQKKRYLDYLNQIRRENEGDDTADSPGYSLNLVRIPVSVLPGKRTDVGHGAEVTMTLTPVYGDDLLPTTFRNLVVNDLLHQLGYPLTQFLNDRKVAAATLNAKARLVVHGLPILNRIDAIVKRLDPVPAEAEIDRYLCTLTEAERRSLPALADQMAAGEKEAFLKLVEDALPGRTPNCPDPVILLPVRAQDPAAPKVVQGGGRGSAQGPGERARNYLDATRMADARAAVADAAAPPGAPAVAPFVALPGAPAVGAAARVQATVRGFAVKLVVPPLAHSPGLINKTGFPTSQLLDVYGLGGCFEIAYGAELALRGSIDHQKYAHLPDVQAFLQQELLGAYRFLREPACQGLWAQFCTPELVTAVRTRDLDRLQTLRAAFREQVMYISRSTPDVLKNRPYNEPQQYGLTAALAWCYLVDSALLADRLIQDMREVATAKGRPLPDGDRWLPYYLPCPPPDARLAFNEYAALRWPVHVFALDPYVQEQNVADQLSTRREIQLALSIAFTNGQISARNLTKYTRRLEAEYETVAVNRTQVGFSHGENVFGWRFYPRFQTPDTESNAVVFARDLLLGGPNRNQLLRQRRLEPGPRECVALVMMPSFVPYAHLDVVGNWFGLANPKHKVFDHTQATRLSGAVRTLQQCEHTVTDAACYRDGELRRLQARVGQLANRLPAQTITFPVPVLNTLGGFEMFSNGTTDLAPELYGWYGAPGIDPTDETTTLFLVGDHFSPLRTRVIAGNQAVDPKNVKMLSRQVVQVTLTKGAYAVGGKDVHIHLATPYGVTRELEVPVAAQTPKPKAPPVGFSFGDAKLTAKYGVCATGPGDKPSGYFVPVPQGAADKLTLKWVAPGGTLTPTVRVKFEFTVRGATLPCASEVVGTVKDKAVEISKEDASLLANDLLRQITTLAGPLPVEGNPLATGLTSTKVTVTPIPMIPDTKTQSVETTDPLKVEFEATGVCTPAHAVPHAHPVPLHLPSVAPPPHEPKPAGQK